MEIQLITNIPDRSGSYENNKKGNIDRNNASSKISTYLKKLNPERFDNRMRTYFNFNNHVKIIATNKIAYLGSQNFSNGSRNNFEAGIITDDSDFISYLFEDYFEAIKEKSIPYHVNNYVNNYDELRLVTEILLNTLNVQKEKLKNGIYRNEPYGFGDYHPVLVESHTRYSEDDFNELSKMMDDLGHLFTLISDISYESTDTKKLEFLCSNLESLETVNLNELSRFEGAFYKFIVENYSEDTLSDGYLINAIKCSTDELTCFEETLIELSGFLAKSPERTINPSIYNT